MHRRPRLPSAATGVAQQAQSFVTRRRQNSPTRAVAVTGGSLTTWRVDAEPNSLQMAIMSPKTCLHLAPAAINVGASTTRVDRRLWTPPRGPATYTWQSARPPMVRVPWPRRSADVMTMGNAETCPRRRGHATQFFDKRRS